MLNPRVAIVIVTWNKKTFVLELLNSLQFLNYDNFDIIVVDNCSSDNTVETIAEHHPNVIIINNDKNIGGAGGFNIGLQYAQDNAYTYCWLLDNDVIVDKDALQYLIHTLEIISEASICGSQILINGSNTIQECGGNIDWNKANVTLNNHGEVKLSNQLENSILDVDYCAACSMLVRISDVNKYGKIDPEMFIFWDDIEWSTRIKSFGRKILCNTNSIVWHHFNGYKPSTAWRVYYRIRNKFYFFNKYSKSKNTLPRLFNIYKELLIFYKYMGIHDFGYAVESAISDFNNGIRGKWSAQSLVPNVSFDTKLDNIPENNYFVIYDHDYEKLNSKSFDNHTKHKILGPKLSTITLISILLKIIFQPSIAVGNQLNPLMPLASYAVILTDDCSRIIQNNKTKNLAFILYRLILFFCKKIIVK